MLVLLVMLVVGFVPTVSNAWGLISPFRDINYGDTLIEGKTGWAVPAKCFWLGTYGSQVNPDAPLGLCLLLISYIWKTGDLFDWPREGYTRYWRNPIDQGFEHLLYFSASRYMKAKHQLWLWLYRVTLPWYIVITASLECIASFSGALWVSLLGILFGTLQILVPRQQNIASTGSKENEWGFGQLVPLILLVQPLGAITEVIWLREGHRRSTVVLHESDLVTAPTFDDTTSPFQANPEANPKEPLISIIARTKPLPIFTPNSIPVNAARAAILHYRRQRQEYLSHSFLFHLEIWLMQIGIAITAAIVLLADYLSIGYQTVEAYEFILVSFGGVIGGLGVVMLVLSPFSRLGRGVKWHTDGEVGGRDQVQVSRVESKEIGVEEARSPTDVG